MSGIFEIADPNFGNLWSSIPASLLEKAHIPMGSRPRVIITLDGNTVFDARVPLCRTFGEVEQGAPVLYINELTRIGFALREANAMQTLKLSFGPGWGISIEN